MSRSHDLFQQAQTHIPGGVNSPVRAFRGVGGDPVFVDRAAGAYLYDADGKQYDVTIRCIRDSDTGAPRVALFADDRPS